MSTVKIHNAENGEVIERDMTAEELANWEADQIIAEQRAEARAKAKLAKTALLEKLGITEDEAKLLLS